MKLAKLVVVIAAFGMLASGISVQASDAPPAGATGTGAAPIQPLGAVGPAVPNLAQPMPVHPGLPVGPSPDPRVGQLGQPLLDQDPGHGTPPPGNPGGKPVGCHCEDFQLFEPKEKGAEAYLFEDLTTGIGFVNVRIPIGTRVLCTPTDPWQGCHATLNVDLDNSDVNWDGGVEDLSILPSVLSCPGKCDGAWHSSENWIVYTGWVWGDWPTAGSLHIRLVGKECDKTPNADLYVTVTFDGSPDSTTPAVPGDVEVGYVFS